MENLLIEEIKQLYQNKNLHYPLRYVNLNHWSTKLENEIQNINIDNLTDFNYSTCFSLFIYPSSIVRLTIGTREFNEYLANYGKLNAVMVSISAIAPYAVFKFWRYTYLEGEIALEESLQPYDEVTRHIADEVVNLLASQGIRILDEQLLSVKVPNVSLELKTEGVTIYNCLFEDKY